jgi:hypothetical protein
MVFTVRSLGFSRVGYKTPIIRQKYPFLEKSPNKYFQIRNISKSRLLFDEIKKTGPLVSVTFIDKDGNRTTVKEPVGTNILEVAHANGIDLEGKYFKTKCLIWSFKGACEGSLACST